MKNEKVNLKLYAIKEESTGLFLGKDCYYLVTGRFIGDPTADLEDSGELWISTVEDFAYEKMETVAVRYGADRRFNVVEFQLIERGKKGGL